MAFHPRNELVTSLIGKVVSVTDVFWVQWLGMAGWLNLDQNAMNSFMRRENMVEGL